MVQAASSALHSIGTGEGDVHPFLCPLDFVALALHQKNEIFLTGAELHGLTDVVHQPEFPALTFLRCTVFPSRHLLTAAIVLGQYIKAVFLTDFIAERTQFFQRIGILPELLSGFKADGVDYKMRMDMVSIAMSADQHLITLPGFCRKFQGNLMCFGVRDVFSGRERLYILIEVHAIHLAVSCLGRFELQNGIHPVAVDTIDEPLPGLRIPCFILAHTVIHNSTHGTEVLLGFPDIGYGSNTESPPRLMR